MIKSKLKVRRCKYCNELFQQIQPLQYLCLPPKNCSWKYQEVLKANNEAKESKDKFKVMEIKCTNWRKKLQFKVQEIVKYIDRGLPCLARGNFPKRYNAGHIYARGGNTSMALNLHNIHRQSAQSNHFQNDDGLLREGLTNEYGKPYMDFISDLRRTPQLKYSNEDYHQFFLKASGLSLILKKSDNEYDLDARISFRNEVNCQLGIYTAEFCNFEK